MGHPLWRSASPWALLLGLLLAAPGCGADPTPPPKAPGTASKKPRRAKNDLELAREALLASRYAEAEKLLRHLLAGPSRELKGEERKPAPPAARADQAKTGSEPLAEARLLLGRLLLLTGRPGEVPSLGLPEEGDAEALWVLASAARAQGNLSAALALSSPPPGAALPVALQLDVLRAEVLLERGQRASAEELLLARVIPTYADGSLDRLTVAEQASALTSIGRAAHLLRSAEDANEAYNQAEELTSATDRLLLYRAELFVEKYDAPHAVEVLEELLGRAPRQPDALVLMARLLLEERMAFEPAREFVRRAREVDPGHPGAHYVLGSIALKDLDFPAVDRHIEAGLERNPRDRELLALQAGARLLAEDRAGFEASLDHLLELSPGYSRGLSLIADHAEWEHRYEEMENLLRRAVRIDREDARARGMLGLTLVRAGSDNAGIVELRRAFEEDPFSVRVKNTLELYEDVIPQHYLTERHGPFEIRVPKTEAPLLLRYVPQLLTEAHGRMVARYGYEPRAPLSIEIYQSREQFAVRTSGLPDTPIQGVCFGRKLATVSPLGSPGNLGMTLWHELAHVFHIGLSESRVPRWLTEGLAEWETEHLGRGWERELDLALYQATRAGRLPEVGQMTRAFTHAKEMEDIAVAYYASGKIAGYLVEERGQPRVTRLLSTLGEEKLPWEAMPAALGIPTDQLDHDFRAHLAVRLRRYESQFVSETTRLSVKEAQENLRKNESASARTAVGQALLLAGEVEEAQRALTQAAPRDPQAAYTLARLLLAQGKKAEALATVEREMLARHADGLEPRLLAAKVELGRGNFGAARPHLERAVVLDPSAEEVWALLARVAQGEKDAALELTALRGWAERAEHDGTVHRRYLGRLLEDGLLEEARGEIVRALWADLGSAETHVLAARTHLRLGDVRAADFEWQSALLCPTRPEERQRLTQEYARALEAAGLGSRARALP